MRNSHFYGETVRARKLKFSGNIALGMTIIQNSEKMGMVAMETWKSWIGGFKALFDPEVMALSQQIAKKLDWNGLKFFG